MFTMNLVPHSVYGKLKVMVSLDRFWGKQWGFWSDVTQTVSRFRGGAVAFLGMVMLKPFLLQKNCFDSSGTSNVLGSVNSKAKLEEQHHSDHLLLRKDWCSYHFGQTMKITSCTASNS